MILLDTNVISEPLRRVPDVSVVAWLDGQSMDTLFLSAVTVAELRAGVELLPAGKRRSGLQRDLEQRILPLFAGRILAFDLACTREYATLLASARGAGIAIGTADSYIAAIAAANGLAVATRDTAPFRAAGLAVINPWEAG
jgi:predicted nucleic acid-binding protein